MNVVARSFFLNKAEEPRIKHRILDVGNRRPPGVVTWQIKSMTSINNGFCLTMERPYIQGLCLNDLLTTKLSTNLSTKQITLLTDTLWQQVISWSICGFIHGDLSPANILYHPQTPQKLYFIDWLLDLRKPAGTPRYCEPRLLFCKNNAEKDQYAMAKIIKEIKINTF